MLRRLIEENIELKVRKACDLGKVKADRGQVEQVLVNLVVNARDAMPRGGFLAIETANVTLDQAYAAANPGAKMGEYVMFAVSDTGAGMTEEVKSHLFEPFFTTKKRGTGTGLGLATSYGIVKKHSGYVEVRSEAEVGTTVKVYLPRLLRDVEIAQRQERAALPGGSETILLVEDEAGVRQVASRLLRMRGYTVQDAGDAAEALELLEQHGAPIDLLLTDVVLPGRGGRELAERVRAVQPRIQVLFATGYNDDLILERQLVERGVEILQKPFTAESLSRTVRVVLDSDKIEERPRRSDDEH
jgi:CheY-like chemotaxis protein